MEWYYRREAVKVGPVSEDQIKDLVGTGAIISETMVWNERIGRWRTYGDVASEMLNLPRPSDFSASPPGYADPFYEPLGGKEEPQGKSQEVPPPKTYGTCMECNRSFPEDELIQYGNSRICGICKERFFQRLREGAPDQADLNYAGFWVRFVAKFIDGLAMSFISVIISMLLGVPFLGSMGHPDPRSMIAMMGAANVLTLALQIAYYVFFIGKFGATPGKMALGLKIVTPEGGQVSYGRACGRFFAEWLSALILMIGYIMAAFDNEKRALHDRICSTRVVRK